jgi:molybdopterin-guanine dinucleotide biosynthesis protein A
VPEADRWSCVPVRWRWATTRSAPDEGGRLARVPRARTKLGSGSESADDSTGQPSERSRSVECLNHLKEKSGSTGVPDRLPIVILAGGKSIRFRGDKLLAPLHGRVVLAHVVDRASPVASEVLVACPSKSREAELAPHLPSSIRFLHDRPERWGKGPAATFASVREEFGEGPLLFVPGDVPWIETRALRRFVASAARSRAEVAAPYWASGETEHLLQWQRDGSILSHLPWRPGLSMPPSWRASEFLRAVPRTLLVPMDALTGVAGSFSHVTYPADLEHPGVRGRLGRGTESRMVEGVPKASYRSAHVAQRMGDIPRAAGAFASESHWYEDAGLALLARHAEHDATHVSAGSLHESPTHSGSGILEGGADLEPPVVGRLR